MFMKKMHRHDSARLSLKTVGPRVPEANLQQYKTSSVGLPVQVREGKEGAHARHDGGTRGKPYKEDFNEMPFCPVLDVDRLDA